MKRRCNRPPTAALVSVAVLYALVSGAVVFFSAGCEGAGGRTTTSGPSTTGTTDYIAEALTFQPTDYTVQTKKVGTDAGLVNVQYRLYRHLTYVADPVDADYQSLDLAVPVEIDGQPVDADAAPILLSISAEDYRSSPNFSPAATSGSSTTTAPPVAAAEDPEDNEEEETGEVDAAPIIKGAMETNADLALAAGYVVVSPGCRGSDNLKADGTYFGKAPAAIVDLKCAVKYLRFNNDIMPGDADRIIAQGSGTGGALAALLGASGDSELYEQYFAELGAAKASDAIYAGAAYCAITDLEHADGAFEWQFGAAPLASGAVDQTLSAQLATGFATYLASLDLVGRSGYGSINAGNYGDYLVQTYLVPAANTSIGSLSEEERPSYLAARPWITWEGGSASFKWEDYVAYVGRAKGIPAFDAFDLSATECVLFGDEAINARHFTEFSVRQTSGGVGPAVDVSLQSATLDADLQNVVDLMNPMYFIADNYTGCAHYWWIRSGTKDNDTSLAVIIDLAIGLENLGKEVNSALYWDAGHGANEDAADFMQWIDFITNTGV